MKRLLTLLCLCALLTAPPVFAEWTADPDKPGGVSWTEPTPTPSPEPPAENSSERDESTCELYKQIDRAAFERWCTRED